MMRSSTAHSVAESTDAAERKLAWRRMYWIALTIVLVALARSPWASGFADSQEERGSDLRLYAAEVEQLRAGGSYYDIAARELPTRGFPTRSVFNWRTPFPTMLIAALPDVVVRCGLGLIAVATWWCIVPWWRRRAGSPGVLLGSFALVGAALPIALAQAWLMPEVWSGLCVGLSIAAFAAQWTRTAVVAGIAALFLRELAAPYVLVCMVFAWRGERLRELAGWCVGCFGYAIFYAWHIGMVLPRIAPDALAHDQSWLACGGATFVISLVQMNVWLLPAPQWVSAIVLCATALSWTMPSRLEWEQRLAWSGLTYVVVFAFVGLPFNQYWGSQIAPLFALSAGLVPAALGNLFRSPHPLREKAGPVLENAGRDR